MASAADVPGKYDVADLAWAAGFIDGEGCIHIAKVNHRGHENFQLVLRVTQGVIEPLEKLRLLFGGSVGSFRATSYTRKQHGYWTSSNLTAASALRLILPYLVVKREQAEIALSFQDLREQDKRRDGMTGRFVTFDKAPYRRFYTLLREAKVVVPVG